MKQYISAKLLQTAEKLRDRIIALRPFPNETLKSLKEYYRIGLTYSSNALEGNSLTESETKVVIEDGLTIEGKPLRDVYEAVGHAKAYDYIHTLAINKPLEESDILELHRLFYEKIDTENAGHYRTIPVFISGSKYAVSSPSKIGTDMKKFLKWFKIMSTIYLLPNSQLSLIRNSYLSILLSMAMAVWHVLYSTSLL